MFILTNLKQLHTLITTEHRPKYVYFANVRRAVFDRYHSVPPALFVELTLVTLIILDIWIILHTCCHSVTLQIHL